ncbi:hypothetical protein RAS1_09250 [Phycisphaerae bacterium RAS1]|nr:hypothetical protein RAS1_09250 [Phycisphaerae bacterium RAS1]
MNPYSNQSLFVVGASRPPPAPAPVHVSPTRVGRVGLAAYRAREALCLECDRSSGVAGALVCDLLGACVSGCTGYLWRAEAACPDTPAKWNSEPVSPNTGGASTAV